MNAFIVGLLSLVSLIPAPVKLIPGTGNYKAAETLSYVFSSGKDADLGRQMVTPEFLRRQADAMAYLKLNYLHLHLTDDEGWRLQLDSHPELVRHSAFHRKPRPLYNAYASRMVPEPEGYVPGTDVVGLSEVIVN